MGQSDTVPNCLSNTYPYVPRKDSSYPSSQKLLCKVDRGYQNNLQPIKTQNKGPWDICNTIRLKELHGGGEKKDFKSPSISFSWSVPNAKLMNSQQYVYLPNTNKTTCQYGRENVTRLRRTFSISAVFELMTGSRILYRMN